MPGKDINKWAKKLRSDHKNPLNKLELTGTKFYVPTGSESEAKAVTSSLDSLAHILRCDRVERRCARSIGKWLPQQKIVEVTKTTAALKKFGFANKNGRFLYPEEALFLLETNRLEVLWNDVPVSIQQAYEVMLDDSKIDLTKYMAYKELTLQGFRVQRTEHLQNNSTEEPLPKKIKLSDNSQSVGSNRCDETFKAIFKELQENGPKRCNLPVANNLASTYELFKTDNCNKHLSDFRLHIYEGKSIEPDVNISGDEVPAVICCTDTQFVKYFRIGHVDIPDFV